MLKKIALAAAVAASSSFATYTFFPVGQANSGQVEAGVQYGWTDNTSDMNITLGAEYVIMQNLELSLTGLAFQLWNEPDDCGEDGHPDCPENAGLKAQISNDRQSAYLLSELKECPKPAFIVPNPNCCYNYGVYPVNNGCGTSVI